MSTTVQSMCEFVKTINDIELDGYSITVIEA